VHGVFRDAVAAVFDERLPVRHRPREVHGELFVEHARRLYPPRILTLSRDALADGFVDDRPQLPLRFRFQRVALVDAQPLLNVALFAPRA
jgi:hypothetical protein